eukprot:TRINITY_DN14522_c0_g1_i1.p1 TRINITY_DN14522_c0_g1~~TRINITY_DN14522_c0_g1_i1.p1  ORF type:complete len:1181 (+),score=138.45 TRINITY_DN14522_c0_g1_i1:1767-5309(+)
MRRVVRQVVGASRCAAARHQCQLRGCAQSPAAPAGGFDNSHAKPQLHADLAASVTPAFTRTTFRESFSSDPSFRLPAQGKIGSVAMYTASDTTTSLEDKLSYFDSINFPMHPAQLKHFDSLLKRGRLAKSRGAIAGGDSGMDPVWALKMTDQAFSFWAARVLDAVAERGLDISLWKERADFGTSDANAQTMVSELNALEPHLKHRLLHPASSDSLPGGTHASFVRLWQGLPLEPEEVQPLRMKIPYCGRVRKTHLHMWQAAIDSKLSLEMSLEQQGLYIDGRSANVFHVNRMARNVKSLKWLQCSSVVLAFRWFSQFHPGTPHTYVPPQARHVSFGPAGVTRTVLSVLQGIPASFYVMCHEAASQQGLLRNPWRGKNQPEVIKVLAMQSRVLDAMLGGAVITGPITEEEYARTAREQDPPLRPPFVSGWSAAHDGWKLRKQQPGITGLDVFDLFVEHKLPGSWEQCVGWSSRLTDSRYFWVWLASVEKSCPPDVPRHLHTAQFEESIAGLLDEFYDMRAFDLLPYALVKTSKGGYKMGNLNAVLRRVGLVLYQFCLAYLSGDREALVPLRDEVLSSHTSNKEYVSQYNKKFNRPVLVVDTIRRPPPETLLLEGHKLRLVRMPFVGRPDERIVDLFLRNPSQPISFFENSFEVMGIPASSQQCRKLRADIYSSNDPKRLVGSPNQKAFQKFLDDNPLAATKYFLHRARSPPVDRPWERLDIRSEKRDGRRLCYSMMRPFQVYLNDLTKEYYFSHLRTHACFGMYEQELLALCKRIGVEEPIFESIALSPEIWMEIYDVFSQVIRGVPVSDLSDTVLNSIANALANGEITNDARVRKAISRIPLLGAFPKPVILDVICIDQIQNQPVDPKCLHYLDQLGQPGNDFDIARQRKMFQDNNAHILGEKRVAKSKLNSEALTATENRFRKWLGALLYMIHGSVRKHRLGAHGPALLKFLEQLSLHPKDVPNLSSHKLTEIYKALCEVMVKGTADGVEVPASLAKKPSAEKAADNSLTIPEYITYLPHQGYTVRRLPHVGVASFFVARCWLGVRSRERFKIILTLDRAGLPCELSQRPSCLTGVENARISAANQVQRTFTATYEVDAFREWLRIASSPDMHIRSQKQYTLGKFEKQYLQVITTMGLTPQWVDSASENHLADQRTHVTVLFLLERGYRRRACTLQCAR